MYRIAALFLILGGALAQQLRVPLPREAAPEFSTKAVVGEDFVDLKLSDYRGKWVVLVHYPFDWTFICPTEIVSLSDKAEEFRAINVEPMAISTDSHHTHLAWIKTDRTNGGVGRLDIPLLADVSKDIARDYGVLVTDRDDEMYGAALRGLFIIDPQGVIRSVQINDDSVGRSVDEIFRLVQGFQYADAHMGEGCPANWQPGADTIKTDAKGAKEYFVKAFGPN